SWPRSSARSTASGARRRTWSTSSTPPIRSPASPSTRSTAAARKTWRRGASSSASSTPSSSTCRTSARATTPSSTRWLSACARPPPSACRSSSSTAPTPSTASTSRGTSARRRTRASSVCSRCRRGTTHPFELFGAPWLDPFKLADRLNNVGLPGVRFRPHYFLPTFQKHAGKVCGGAELHVTNRALFEPYRTGLWCVKVARDIDPERFDWRRETYEFVSDRLAIDLLAGSDRYRHIVEGGGDVD